MSGPYTEDSGPATVERVRLVIYVDPVIKREARAAAALTDQTVSDYCAGLIALGNLGCAVLHGIDPEKGFPDA